MIFNIVISLSLIFPKAMDTTYIYSDSVIYFANYECSETISEKCLSSKALTYENFINILNETTYEDYKNLDSFFCNDDEVRNILIGFFMNKFVGRLKNSTIKDSLDFSNLLKLKSRVEFTGNYLTKQRSVNHLIYKAFFNSAISKSGKYIFPSFGDFVFMITMKNHKIASIVALKSQVKYNHYYSRLNEDSSFTAYEPLDVPDVTVDMDILSSEEKKDYLKENNNLEIHYSKYKIDENGRVVLCKQ